MRSLLALLLLVGCGRTAPLDEPGRSTVTLKAKGLWTSPNPYGSIPDGAAVVADNVMVLRPDVWEPRRGYSRLAGAFSSGGSVQALTEYQDTLIAHTSQSKLAYYTGSAWTELSGTYAAPTGRRMQFEQANGNLYFTTSLGLYKLTAYNGTPEAAGGIQALYGVATATGTTGFLTAGRSAAYRVVWAKRDDNDNEVVGAPSERFIGTNSAIATSTTGNMTRAGSTVTVTTAANHGLTTGDVVFISSTDPNYPSGTFTVTVTGATTFTYTQAGTVTASLSAGSVYWATRNISVAVRIPSGVTAYHYAQVYRSRQTADSTATPDDELGLVYEYFPTALEIAAASFTFTDISPDALRGQPLYSNATQEGILQSNDPPPLAVDVAEFKGHLVSVNVSGRQRLNVRLLTTTGLVDRFIVFGSGTWPPSVATAYASIYGQTAAESGSNFQVTTSGTTAQNIEATARSMVRCLNNSAVTNSSDYRAAYASGPDDPPGLISIWRTGVSSAQFYYFSAGLAPPPVADMSADPISPGGAYLIEIPSGARYARTLGTTVTVDTSSGHGFVAGQTVYVQAGTVGGNLSADANFPVGAKVIATVPTSSTFTYTEAGSNVNNSVYYRVQTHNLLEEIRVSDPSARADGLRISKFQQPEAWPESDQLACGDETNECLRGVRLGETFFIFREKGLWSLRGDALSGWSPEEFDPTVELVGPRCVTKLRNRLWAWTKKGVIPISESGVGAPVSLAIDKTLRDIQTLSLSGASAYSFLLGNEVDGVLKLSTISSASDLVATQTFVYPVDTQAWTRHTPPSNSGGSFSGFLRPSNGLEYRGDNNRAEQERHTDTAATTSATDNADTDTAFTIVSATGNTVTLSLSDGISVGDAIVQSTRRSTVTANNTLTGVLTVADSGLAWTAAACTIYSAFQSRIEWAPFTNGEPTVVKNFGDRAELLFGDARLSTATFDVASETDTTFAACSLTNSSPGIAGMGGTASPSVVEVSIADNQQNVRVFRPRFTVTNALSVWSLYGLDLHLQAKGKGGR